MASAELLGVCGIQRRGAPDVREIGYWLRSSAVGKGHATTAANALTAAALALPGVLRVEIRCDAGNCGAQRWRGFRLVGTVSHTPEAPGHTGTFMVWVHE